MEIEKLQERTANNGHSPLVADAYGHDYALDDMSLEELQAIGTTEGIDWSQTGHQNRLAKARHTARKHTPQKPPVGVQAVQTVILWVGNMTLMAIMFLAANVVLPLGMVALPYAEQARVQTGIAMFDPANARMLSVIVVVFMLGLLFVQAHRGNETKHTKFSLRILRRDIEYMLGVGKNWRKQTITSDDMLSSAIVWNNRLIVFLGTIGALQDEIALHAAGKPWIQGARAVAMQSDLNTMFALFGAAVVTASLLYGMRFVVGYNYGRFMALMETADFFSNGSASAQAEREAMRQYVMAQVVKNRMKAQQ